MKIVDVGARPRDADDDGARRHAQRPRHLPRRLHRDAGRLGLRLRLQLVQRADGGLRLRDRLPRAGAAGRRADRALRRGVEGRPHRRLRRRGHATSAASASRCSAAARTRSRASRAVPAGAAAREETTHARARHPRPATSSRSRPPAATRSPALQLQRLQRDAAARLRQRAALPPGLRREGRAPRRPEAAGRPGEVPVHRQEGPARQLPVRHVRRAARAGGAHPRSSGTTGKPTVVGYTQNDIDTWADLVARSIRAAGGRAGDIVHVAYGYGLFTGGLGAHYGAERAGCTVIPMSRRPDREAGAADPRLQARHHHGHAELHAGDHRGVRAPGPGPARRAR